MPLVYFTAAFAFCVGAAVGSFLNVVTLRHNTGMDLGGQSRCFSCRKVIRWFENIPVVSWLMLRGKCSYCKSAISIQYPLVELFTAGTFAAVAWKVFSEAGVHGATVGFVLYVLTLMSLLIAIFVYDLRHTIIPNSFVYPFITAALAGLAISGWWQGFDTVWWLDLAAGPILFTPFWALWYLSGGTWMGLGDGKLALGAGWFLGLAEGLSGIVLGFWIGAGYVLFAMAVRAMRAAFRGDNDPASRLTLKSQIPLGPFLIAGIIVEFLFAFDVLQLHIVIRHLI